ncbi:ATP-binding protein [Bacteroidota bacterium]
MSARSEYKIHLIKLFIIVIDLLLLSLCIYNIKSLLYKPDLPIEVSQHKDGLIVVNTNDDSPTIESDDIVLSINGINFHTKEELEVYVDFMKIGESLSIDIIRGENRYSEVLKTVRFYGDSYIVLSVIIFIAFYAFALFVLLKQYNDPVSHIFHWLCIGVSLIVALTWGSLKVDPLLVAFIGRILFHVAYSFTAILLLHFALIFPAYRKKHLWFILLGYLTASLFALLPSIQILRLKENLSIVSIQKYLQFFNYSRLLLLAAFMFALILFIYKYKKSKVSSFKNKIKWVIYGLSIGPLAYFILWAIPQSVSGQGLVPEELILILILSIPVAFTIGIIKHHLFNINFIIKRSIAYTIVLSFFIIAYTILVVILTSIINIKDSQIPSLLAAISLALLFQPLRVFIQNTVDKVFFRVHYDFRKALKDFFYEIGKINDIQSLADTIVIKTNVLIPVEKIGFFVLKSPENRIRLLSHIKFDFLKNRGIRFESESLKVDLNKPVAIPEKVEHGAEIDIADNIVFRRWGMDVVFPIKSSTKKLYGFLVLGNKKSDTDFSIEDLDLLNTVTLRAGNEIERINLQEEIIRKKLETERLEELNRTKSFFVSSVSHDLKTPLTSIKMFAQFLEKSEGLKEKDKDYIEIIEGESDRLTRLIDNVLNYTKIEKGIKEYIFEKVELNTIILDVYKLMVYQFKLENVDCKLLLPDESIYIYADSDALKEALINLVSNSIKYSGEVKQIKINLNQKDDFVSVSVKDNGFGIYKDELNNIFEEDFQIKSIGSEHKKGAGLGLTIVKHITKAHNGTIEVQSELKKGSTFILNFPRYNG